MVIRKAKLAENKKTFIFIVRFVVFQIIALLVCLSVPIVTLTILKVNLAESVFTAARHAIKIGDLRQSLIFIEEASKKYHFDTTLFDGNNIEVFSSTKISGLNSSVPSENGLSLKGYSVSFPLDDWSKLNGLSGGRIAFRFSILDNIALALFSFVCISLLSIPFFISYRKNIFRIYHDNIEFEKTIAIAKTTQMLAHDVRRPFSMVKAVMQAVEASPDINLARELLKLSIPEINQAMASVEGMVQDIMQIGTEAKPVLETVCPKQIILNALKELFRVYPDADVSIETDFRNTGYISIDTTRFSRVFSNILGNALQAMQGKGTLWFKTSNFEDRVLFRIGNSGSIIPQENLARLFDAFFTSGKKGGTGLGLAIAKKIVEMHGGFIGCHSEKTNKYPDGYVEFSFSVPHSEVTADLQSRSCSSIPSHSKQFYEEFARQKELASSSPPVDEREAELTREILSKIALSEPPLPILVVDDEAIYRNNIESLLKKTPQINSKIAIIWAKNANDALAKVREYDPLLVIQDIDLGLDSESGIEVINRMRESGFKGQICVHSNRFLPTDNKEALDAGAGHILPKPMTGIHLLKLIATALDGTNTP